ncbi:MAG TPA: STAS domain-containing protein [Gammaproteobacteria bacterium]
MSQARIESSSDSTLRVSGELTFATVTALNREAAPLLGHASGTLVIDLGGVTRADSAGLALLIEWLRRVHRQGATLRFSHMPAQMHSIATVSDLEPILSVCE